MNLLASVQSRLAKFDESIRIAQSELEAKSADLEAKQAEAEIIKKKHRALTREVDQLAEGIVWADSLFELKQSELAANKTAVLDLWSDSQLFRGPDYSGIVELQASVADYPRVRAYMETKLKTARGALADLEQEYL